MKHPFWEAHQDTIDRENFRASPHYLEQRPDYPYAEIVAFLRKSGMWRPELTEDGSFGVVTAKVDGVTVSRDLLDSMLEIAFLELAGVDLVGARVLDIGAGYGRLAHRMLTAFPGLSAVCTDAIDVSLEVCRRYLGANMWRWHGRAVWTIPQKDIEAIDVGADLAVNVHCWSECSREEVQRWIGLLAKQRVPQLFIVPHPDRGLGTHDEGHPSYAPDLYAAGYRLAYAEKSWPACNPKDYYLFRLEGT